jgi:hypothetical protein
MTAADGARQEGHRELASYIDDFTQSARNSWPTWPMIKAAAAGDAFVHALKELEQSLSSGSTYPAQKTLLFNKLGLVEEPRR